jgi:hypothetical protein
VAASRREYNAMRYDAKKQYCAPQNPGEPAWPAFMAMKPRTKKSLEAPQTDNE